MARVRQVLRDEPDRVTPPALKHQYYLLMGVYRYGGLLHIQCTAHVSTNIYRFVKHWLSSLGHHSPLWRLRPTITSIICGLPHNLMPIGNNIHWVLINICIWVGIVLFSAGRGGRISQLFGQSNLNTRTATLQANSWSPGILHKNIACHDVVSHGMTV